MKTVAFYFLLALAINCNAQITGDSLRFYMPFQFDAIDLVDGIHGTLNNVSQSSDRFGQENSSFVFNGTNSYISCDKINFELISKMAISVWIKTLDTKKQFIVDHYNWRIDAGYHLSLMDGIPRFNGRDNNDEYIRCFGLDSINDGKWHNIVGNLNDSIWQLWVDGYLVKEVNTGHTNVNISNDSPLQFGRFHLGDDDIEHNYFNGQIDDVRIFNNFLDSTDIKYLFYGDCKGGNVIYDTIQISVTDTLIIDVELTNTEPIENNIIKVYPNPTNDMIYINTGTFELMDNYKVKIVSQNSSIVFESEFNKQEFEISLNEFGSTGIYFIQIYDSNNSLITIRKILLK